MSIRTNRERINKYGTMVAVLVLFFSCKPDSIEEVPPQEFGFTQPTHFPEATYSFDKNPISKEGFELGKRLFYDPLLSRDGSVSCNTCHIQGTTFADAQQHPISIGIDGRHGTRNAPALGNLAFFPEFFWDGGVTHLDFVPINAIEAPFEMDETLANVITKLNNVASYKTAFKIAFGIDTITSPYLLQALSQFSLMMVSDNSKYDAFLKGQLQLTTTEQQGLHTFSQKCASCHSGVLQSDFSYRNNGLDEEFEDLGRAIITEFSGDNGKFRVPSLRNVAYTAPYMHDGRMTTLDQVLDHYQSGIQQSSTLDPMLKDGIPLTNTEKENIIAFLHTLSDPVFKSNPLFRQ